jgi:hypothetical protein
VILSTSTLNLLQKEKGIELIYRIKENTTEAWLNVITPFTERNPEKDFPYLVRENELGNYYHDWQVSGYKEFLTPFETHGRHGKTHRQVLASLIARKR